MEKILQDNYSKSWYSKVVLHGKISSDLHFKKVEHVGYKMYLKKKNYTSLLSSHPHALQQRQVGLDDDHDQILACQKIRSEWALLLFFIQHFPFLSDLKIKHNSRGHLQLKKMGKCGSFSQVGDPPAPPPRFGNPMFVRKKLVYFVL